MQAYRPFVHYLRPHWRRLALALLCAMIAGGGGGAGLPWVFENVLKQAFEARDAAAAGAFDWRAAAALAALIPAVFLVRAVFGYASGMLSMRVAVEVGVRLQQDVFGKLQHMPLAFFDRAQRGDTLVRLTSDTTRMYYALLDTVPEFLRQPFIVCGALGYLGWQAFAQHEAGFLLGFLVVAPLCLLPVQMVGRNLRRRSRELVQSNALLTQHLWENFNAIHEIRSFSLEAAQTQGFARKLRGVMEATYKIKKYLLLQQPSMEVLISLLVAVVFLYAWRQGITFPTFSAMGLALFFAFDPVKRLGQAWNRLHEAEPSAARVAEFFALPADITDPPAPRPLAQAQGEIVFEHVEFAYEDGKPVLQNVSARIPADCRCALVGPSGAGKSTFAKMIPRFYDVRGGRVLLDGVDVRDVRQADLRRNVAVVSQFPVLFDISILENIRLGRPGASDDEVRAAARRAHADAFIAHFPDGYDTTAGDRGDRLSGGQKQRIAIARAFLKDAPVLILDEATSALDAESEQAVREALAELAQGRTVVTIAHRLSTIRSSDLILVFDRGAIVAQGTHAELLRASPLYQNLVNHQLDLPESTVTRAPWRPAAGPGETAPRA